MIQKILLENCGPHVHMELEPGVINIIRGPNGAGKSFVLRSLLWMIEGGADPTLFNRDSNWCRVTLWFEDGTKFVKYQERSVGEQEPDTNLLASRVWQTGKDPRNKYKYTLSGEGPDGNTIRAPKEALNRLIASMAANPDAIIEATKRKRVEMLLDILPVTFTPEEISEVFEGDKDVKAPRVDVNLEAFESYVDGTYARRRVVNGNVNQLRASIAMMRDKLPNDPTRDLESERADGEKALSEIKAEIAAAESASNAKYLAGAAAHNDAAGKNCDKHRDKIAEIDAVVAGLLAEKGELKLAIEEEKQRAALACRNFQDECTKELAGTVTGLIDKRSELARQLESISGELKLQTQADGVRKAIRDQEAKVEGYCLMEMALTKCLEKARKLKAAKLKDLPIEGLDIEGEEITIGGIKFDDLSTAEQRAVAYQISQIGGNGQQQIVIVDKAENFDQASIDALIEAAKGKVQLFAAEVDREAETLEFEKREA